jgi:hypothetical protein
MFLKPQTPLTSPELLPHKLTKNIFAIPDGQLGRGLQAMRHNASKAVRFCFPRKENTSASTGPTLKRNASGPTPDTTQRSNGRRLGTSSTNLGTYLVWGLHMDRAGTRIVLEQWRNENIKQCEIPRIHHHFDNFFTSVSS